ncbi:MAG TPA: FecR domain-containing protein [Verrucomicrobiae bacterium]|nr:FecR domain-containing protein [Verrucomicrobiae bacterium]
MQRFNTTPAIAFRLALAMFVVGVSISQLRSQSTNSPAASRLVEFAGKVEVTVAGTNDWHLAVTNQWLKPGDRLRTDRDSRATLQLSDRSTIRVNQLTTIEIRPPTPPARHRFSLRRGALFFLDREKPADVEFETPLTSGAIRGTEFFLTVAETNQATFLAMLDGAVELSTASEQLRLTNGQQVLVNAAGPAQMPAVLPAVNLIQWSFYYPAVVNVADLSFTADETKVLAKSLAAYESGDLLRARAEAPAEMAEHSASTRVYFAALKLAVGQVEDAEHLVAGANSLGQPVRELIAAVRFQTISRLPMPTNGSGWLARSYYLQSRSSLPEALNAARQATRMAPEFGFAWARVAELELGFEHRDDAERALGRARQLTPLDAQAVALEGFLALADNHPSQAEQWFDRALAIDGSLPTAWVGRGLARAQSGNDDGARRDFQIAATLEPNRGLFRSYLGKAWSQSEEDALAEKDLRLAKELDPADPTAWLYSALHHYQTHQVNAAVRDLEKSEELNDNRSVFRSRLQLDQDLATRSADLAAIYDAAGLTEVSERAASRAVEQSYSDFSGHLFLADSLRQREDPDRFNLRLETARESELLVANLLAPPGGGNLSQLLPEQDRLQYFDTRPFGFSMLTQYRSDGNWEESATAFGQVGNFSYAFDGRHFYQNGQRPNNELSEREFSVQVKQQVTASDSLYVQAGYFRSASGDVAQHYDPSEAVLGLRAKEVQNPNVFVGWNHEWAPGSHTLVLLSRLTDSLSLTNPQPSVLTLKQDGAGFDIVQPNNSYTLNQHFDFTLYSAEAQQIWETEHQALIFGGRYQHGTVDTHAVLSQPPFGAVEDQRVSPYLERINGYGYYQLRPVSSLRLTAGLSYDRLTYPQNVDLPPMRSGESDRGLLAPKIGATWEPWQNGWLRAAWTRSLGGLFFDNSIRLEPAQVAGFTSAFRSLIPESTEGLVPGTKFDSWTLGFDQKLPSETYFGLGGEWLTSSGSRDAGAFSNSVPFVPFYDSPTTTRQSLDFRERNASVYVYQLLGDCWSAGAQYRLSEAKLQTALPELAGVPGASFLNQDERAVLQHGRLFLLFNHPSGFFAEWSSDWFHQDNHGYSPALAGDDFWQHNIFAGYVFAHRRVEVRVGLLNLTDENYHLNPLNLRMELPHGRTFTTSLRLNF